ncbi:Uncharacterized RNA methyltransferase BR0438/BS1330_I0439 [Azospirillaceae bacterium]
MGGGAARMRKSGKANKTGRLEDAEIEVLISDIGGRGDGIALSPSGVERVFVPLTVPGDRVRVRIVGRSGEGARGEVSAWLERGAESVNPVCRHFGVCGGCALQHLAPAAERAWKRRHLVEQLRRAGIDCADSVVEPVAAIAPGERRRASFMFHCSGGVVAAGFNPRMSHRVVDLEECPAMLSVLAAKLPALRRGLARILKEGQSLDGMATALEGGVDLLLTGPLEMSLEMREGLAALAEDADLARLSWRRAERESPEPVAHRRSAVIRFGGVAVEPPYGGFLQPSAAGERLLVERVVEETKRMKEGVWVADLFSGCGTFAFSLARRFKVSAVENDAAAVASAGRAASGVGGAVVVVQRDLFSNPLTALELARFEAVIFDPPRAGALAQARELARSRVPIVVAASCNPMTFARDARLLVDGGYRLTGVLPVDQFPWSPHLELMASFVRS